MGGPCYILVDGKKVVAPPATDTFQIMPFEYPLGSGEKWWSVEQCYQAQKFDPHSKSYRQIKESAPLAGQSAYEFGMAVWRMGQRSPGNIREDWEDVKVTLMYLINCAKYATHPKLQEDLVAATGNHVIMGAPSSWDWSLWNGRIQTLIRNKIAQGCDLSKITSVTLEEFQFCVESYGDVFG